MGRLQTMNKQIKYEIYPAEEALFTVSYSLINSIILLLNHLIYLAEEALFTVSYSLINSIILLLNHLINDYIK